MRSGRCAHDPVRLDGAACDGRRAPKSARCSTGRGRPTPARGWLVKSTCWTCAAGRGRGPGHQRTPGGRPDRRLRPALHGGGRERHPPRQQDTWSGGWRSPGPVLYDVDLHGRVHFTQPSELQVAAHRWTAAILAGVRRLGVPSAPVLLDAQYDGRDGDAALPLRGWSASRRRQRHHPDERPGRAGRTNTPSLQAPDRCPCICSPPWRAARGLTRQRPRFCRSAGARRGFRVGVARAPVRRRLRGDAAEEWGGWARRPSSLP